MRGWGRAVVMTCGLGRTGATAFLIFLTTVGATAAADSACRHDVIGGGRVKAVADGRGFVLDDGREVRLAGIEVPALRPEQEAGARAGEAAMAALAQLILGHEVVLRKLGGDRDRYGRISAYVTLPDGERVVQAELLGQGYARVSGRLERACAVELWQRERQARAARLGLWADPYYEVRRADDPTGIAGERGRFALVEGKIVSVRESGGTIYLNFGRRWSQDFTVTIPKRLEASFTAAGLEPKKLENRRVLIRGWVEQRGGPWIEASRPEQIEIADRI